MISRRRFLTGAAIALAPTGAPAHAQEYKAQQAGKVYKIGYLEAGSSRLRGKSFLQGLHDLGYVESRDFVMEYRWTEGHADRLPDLAADLVRARVDVIVTGGTPATMAAKQATQTIPIVFRAAGQVVEKGSGPAARAGQRTLAMDERVCVPRHGAEEGHAMALPLRKRSRQAEDGTAQLAKILTDAPIAARVTSMSVGLTRLDTRPPWALPPV